MALSIIQIKRWYLMLIGKSIEHVDQKEGSLYEIGRIAGYYNDLTQKVILYKEDILDKPELPKIKQLDGTYIIFPVAVFQYALGCYDLFLSTGNEAYIKKFLQCAKWTLETQDEKGRWDNFSYTCPQSPYGAMAQGEAASVLIRAFVHLKDRIYLDSAKKAIDFMLTSITEGGTSIYSKEDLIFKEYTHLPVVLNGWIFAWWGLYDYVLVSDDKGEYCDKLEKSCKSLIKYLPLFKSSFWSKYDLSNRLASPFYHSLHVSQLRVMYKLTDEMLFEDYARMWEKQLNNPINKCLAFFIKAIQKVLERE